MNIFNTPTTVIKGVAKKRAAVLAELGIDTLYDLITFLPSNYEDRRIFSKIEDLSDGNEVCLNATVNTVVKTIKVRSNLTITNCVISDDTGEINVIWYNHRFVEKQLFKGHEYNFYGKVKKNKNRLELISPIFEEINNIKGYTGTISPVYPLLSKIPQKTFYSIMKDAIEYSENIMASTLPRCVEDKYNIPDIFSSIKNVHFPENEQQILNGRQRFAFEEFFYFQAAMAIVRKNSCGSGFVFQNTSVDWFENRLFFSLTSAQRKVINEIKNDLTSGKQMNRLLQGDVGSGKTVVAMISAVIAKQNGYCSVVIAPTEVLAKQHFSNFLGLLPEYKIELLTSSVSTKEKKNIYEKTASGEIDILIGTHAILEDVVKFNKLGLVIVDEQHRFGVRQRQKLIEKGVSPHLLVMTATPIPRTLSLILFNDLDISVIDSLPCGRKPIKTYLVGENYRERIYTFVQKEIDNGGQAYIICPLVEESETFDLKDVMSFSEELKLKMPNVKIGVLHGKMKECEKDLIMDDFKNKKIEVLVSTTVVEVGVDVKNATLMIVEDAERFGLSQLHQLRGRVGRGDKQSYCILIAKTSNPETIKRLRVIESSNDGFYISEQDLKHRGPGDFLGTRQHGLPILKMPVGEGDIKLLHYAKQAINEISQKLLNPSENELKIMEYLLKKRQNSENNANILN